MTTTHDIERLGSDESALKRFVCGIASPQEATAIETRRSRDPGLAEQLDALEDEMLRDYLRDELPPEWRRPLDASLAASLQRRERLEATRVLIRAIEAAEGRAQAAVRETRSHRAWWPIAASLLVAMAGGWYALRPSSPEADAPASASKPVLSLVLRPTTTRSEAASGNTLSLGGSRSATIRIVGILPAVSTVGADVPCTLRPVGADALSIDSRPRFEPEASGSLSFEWLVPQERLEPGDYVLTIGDAAHAEGVLGAWAFSIVP